MNGVFDALPDDPVIRATAVLVSETYAAIEAECGFEAAEGWYWRQHVGVCNSPEKHGCRAFMRGGVPILHPTIEELMQAARDKVSAVR